MTEHLCETPIHTFLDRVAAATPAPGGGSVAAAAGALGASLLQMVAGLSMPKATDETRPQLVSIQERAHGLRDELCSLIDHDALAYENVMTAYKLPKDQEDRKEKIQAALWEATETPLQTLESCRRGEALAAELAPLALESAASDVQVAQSMLRACSEGARANVLINLPLLKDEGLRQQAQARLEA